VGKSGIVAADHATMTASFLMKARTLTVTPVTVK
jgi:hypothetical protein